MYDYNTDTQSIQPTLCFFIFVFLLTCNKFTITTITKKRKSHFKSGKMFYSHIATHILFRSYIQFFFPLFLFKILILLQWQLSGCWFMKPIICSLSSPSLIYQIPEFVVCFYFLKKFIFIISWIYFNDSFLFHSFFSFFVFN